MKVFDIELRWILGLLLMSPLVIFIFVWLKLYLAPVSKAREGELDLGPVIQELRVHPLSWPVSTLAGSAVAGLLFLAGCFVFGIRPSSTEADH